MKKYLWTAFAFLLALEVYSILPPRREPMHLPGGDAPGPTYEVGVIHVHSIYSDGSGTVPEIADAANKAGLDFLILTDHNSTEARRKGLEKRYGKTDLFVEMEASTPAGHCLSFYSQTPARRLSDDEMNHLSWAHFLSEPSPPGMFICIAHPSNIKNPWGRLDRFPEGIEVVNFDSLWQRELYESILGFGETALIAPFNNYLAALRWFQLYRKDFIAWDAMNSISPGHFGILAQDTHALLKFTDRLSVRWPEYLQTFRLGSNVIFVDDPIPTDFEARKSQLYQSLHQGRVAILFQEIHPFPGNDWRLECNGHVVRSGQEASGTDCQFIADIPPDLPYPVTLHLWKDGDLIQTVEHAEQRTILPARSPGAYRLEVWVHPHTIFHLLLDREVPYVLYNPIFVR